MAEMAKNSNKTLEWTINNWKILLQKEGNPNLHPNSKEMRIQIIRILEKLKAQIGLDKGEGYVPTQEESQCLSIPDESSSGSGASLSDEDENSSINEFEEADTRYVTKANYNTMNVDDN